jgi:SAM-dependent methyltransferase
MTTTVPAAISEEQAAALDHELYELGLPSDARHMRLVEFGSGTGELISRAIRTGVTCVGIEPDADNRRLSALRIEELVGSDDSVSAGQVGLTDAASDVPANLFDFAIALRCDSEFPVPVAEIARVLKPGGRWLVTVKRSRGAASHLFLDIAAVGLQLGNVEEIPDDTTTAQRVRVTGIKPRYEDAD